MTEPKTTVGAPATLARRLTSPGVVLALALVIVTAVGARAFDLRVDSRVHDEYAGRLRQMVALEHRLNEQVLRKYAALSGSYDPLVRTMRELRDLHREASVVPSFVDETGRTEVLASLEESNRVLAIQEHVVEQFKTENAILLNSLRYFPVAAGELAETLSHEPGAEAQVTQVRDLLRDVLRIAVSPTPDAIAEVQIHIASIDPGGSHEGDFRIVLRHASRVTTGRQTVDHLLAELLAQQGGVTAAALGDAYERHYRVAQARAHAGFDLLLACVVFAVASVAASIFARMRADAAVIRAASARLAQSIDRQNRFVSMTSHEFRTPLSVIVSSADLLRAYGDKWSREQHDKHLTRIERAGRGMTDLLDGILLIGRTDAGHRDFRPGRVDLSALAHDVVEHQRLRAKGGVTVQLETSPVAEWVFADARLLRLVLDNLVANAVKYSKPSGVVRVRVVREEDAVIFEVEDAGIGIPLVDQEKLFDTFHRASNVGTIQGTGLGLAIVKRAVDLHGGHVAVTSKTDVGTRFDVVIPVRSADGSKLGDASEDVTGGTT